MKTGSLSHETWKSRLSASQHFTLTIDGVHCEKRSKKQVIFFFLSGGRLGCGRTGLVVYHSLVPTLCPLSLSSAPHSPLGRPSPDSADPSRTVSRLSQSLIWRRPSGVMIWHYEWECICCVCKKGAQIKFKKGLFKSINPSLNRWHVDVCLGEPCCHGLLDLALTLPWPCLDIPLTLPWPCFDLALTLLWPCLNLALTLPYLPGPCPNLAFTLSWPCLELALSLPRPCLDLALNLPLPCLYPALTLPWPCPDLALTLPWPCL